MKINRLYRMLSVFVVAIATTSALMADEEQMVNFEDHIKPIFREHCTTCHSESDKNSGLSVETFASTLEGGSGGASLISGDSANSRMLKLITHQEQPTMPPDEDKIDAAKIELIRTWIDQGMPENSGSKIKRKKVQVVASSLGASGRPEGELPMPNDLLLQTPRYTARAAAISALAASPWSPLVAIGGQMQVALYHVETGELLGVIPFPEGEPQSITFSRDGKLMLVGGGQHSKHGIAALFDITTGERITTVGDELDIVLAADISEDNSKIALAGPNRVVRIFDTSTGELIREMKKHTDWIYSLRFSPDGLLLASGDRSNGLVVWETDTGRLYQDLLGHKADIRSLEWRSDSLVLYSGSMDNSIKMWDMNNGNLIKSWDAHGGGVTAIDMCNDGTLASTGRDNIVRVWDAGGNALVQMPNLAESGMEVAVSVDSKFVIAGDWLGNVRCWNRAKVEEEKPMPANPPTLDMQIASVTETLNAVTAARDAAQAEVAQMTLASELQNKLTAKQTAVAQFAQEITAIQESMAGIESKVNQAQQNVAQQDIVLETKLKEQLEISDRIAVAMANSETLQARLASMQNDPNSSPSNESPAQESEEFKAVSQQLQQANATADALQVEMNNKISEIKEAEANLDQMRTVLQQERNALAVARSKTEMLTQMRTESETQIGTLTASLEEATQAYNAANSALAAKQAEVDRATQRLQSLQQQTQKIEARRAGFTQKATELQAKIDEFAKVKLSTEAELQAKQKVVEEKLAQMVQMQQQIDAVLASKQAIELEKAQAEAEMKAKQDAVRQAEDSSAELQGELQAVAAEQERFNQAYSAQ